MARWLGWCAALAAALALTAPARAQVPAPAADPTAQEEEAQPLPADPVERYRLYGYLGMMVDGPRGLQGWDAALKAALRRAAPAQAARRLAPAWGLSEAQMAELVDLWIAYDGAASAAPRRTAELASLAERAKALLRASGGARLPAEAAGVVVSAAYGCGAPAFMEMTRGLPDPAATGWWLVLGREDCAPWRAAFLDLAPGKAAALMLLEARAEHDAVPLELALKEWAASEAAMTHVAPADRPRAAAAFARRKLTHLLDAGLAAEAVAYADALGPERLAAALAPIPPSEVVVDGLPLRLDGEQSVADARLWLAAGYAAVGRAAEARALLAEVGGLRRAWTAAACEADLHRRSGRACDPGFLDDGKRVMLDQLLTRPDADPYLLAEAYNGQGHPAGVRSGVWAEVACRLFDDPGYGWICEAARRQSSVASEEGWAPDKEAADAQAALAAAAIPDWSARLARATALLAAHARLSAIEPDKGAEAVLISGPAPDCAGERAEAGELLGRVLTGGPAGPAPAPAGAPAKPGWTLYPPRHGFEPLVTWPPAADPASQPLLVEGRPEDFACLKADRPVLVHSAAQAFARRRQGEAFVFLVRVSPPTFNRARTRGFVVWSTEANGGSIRFLRTAKGWTLEEYDSWIR